MIEQRSRFCSRRVLGRLGACGVFVVFGMLGLPGDSRVPAQDDLSIGFPVNWFARCEAFVILGGTHSISIREAGSLQQVAVWRIENRRCAAGCGWPPIDEDWAGPASVGERGARRAAAAEPGGRLGGAPRLVVVGATEDQEGFVAARTLDAGHELWRVDGLEGVPVCIAVDHELVFVGDDAGTVTAYRAEDGHRVWTRQVHSKLVTSIVAFPTGMIASADWGGKIVVARREDGGELHDFQQHRDRVSDLGGWYSGSPTRLYSCGWDGTVRLWYPEQFRMVRFTQLSEPVIGLEVVDRSQVVTSTYDGRLQWIDMNLAKVARSEPSGLSFVHAMLLVDRDRLLLSDGLGRVRVAEVPREP